MLVERNVGEVLPAVQENVANVRSISHNQTSSVSDIFCSSPDFSLLIYPPNMCNFLTEVWPVMSLYFGNLRLSMRGIPML